MSLDDRKKLVRHHIDLSWNKGRTALAEQLHSKDFLYKSSFIGRPLTSPAFAQMIKELTLLITSPAYREFRRVEAKDRRIRYLALVEAGFTEAQAIHMSKD